MPDLDGLDPSERELAREKCDFYDEYNRKWKGDLVVTSRRLIFQDSHNLHHSIELEKIQGFYVETTGMIGAYLRVDYDSPNGIAVARYKGSLVQAEYLMDRVREGLSSNGSIRTYEGSSLDISSGKSLEVPQYSRPRIDSMKGRYDECYVGGLYLMWMEVIALILPLFMLSGWPYWPGYGRLFMFLYIGFIAFTIVLTFWWTFIRGKKAIT
ncbi:MAG: hypothetical protein ACFFEU_03030 [Candidatus Thorarchaeota archaeon]